MGHPSVLLWTAPEHGLLHRIQAQLRQRNAHPARTVVLLPYAQLLPLAARLWAQCFPDGFAPRFETTLNWSTSLGAVALCATDVAFDMAIDTLNAQALLRGAGFEAQQDALSGLLVQATHQLAPLAAACHPQDRAAWVQGARQAAVVGMEGPVLGLEAAVARIAVEWAAISAYSSDVLFETGIQQSLDCLVMVQGFAPDPLVAALQPYWGTRLASLTLAAPDSRYVDSIAWHACADAQDEAQRTAACVVQHIAAGRFPVALVCTDRALTRPLRAILENAGAQIRDETGWKLSTSHCAAQVMALLKAANWNASSDAVLAWLKSAPAFANAAAVLEPALRRDQANAWQSAGQGNALKKSPLGLESYLIVNQVLKLLTGHATLALWQERLRFALQTCGVWDGLQTDEAGIAVLSALRLAQPPLPAWTELLDQALWRSQPMDLADFTSWVNQALEGARFSAPYPDHEQVVILPMNQMLARPFAALVMAGCDEVRLNPSPEPAGGWTAPQRSALGLPSREALAQVLASAWQHALQTPHCDVLWRCSDDTGETLMPSALVQQVQWAQGNHGPADDPRVGRSIAAVGVPLPRPSGQLLPVRTLSASAYEDLRNCPYRFFAMRQLGLQAVDELDGAVDKRDFGLWLHEVLKRFHEKLAELPPAHQIDKEQLLDEASQETTQSMHLLDGEFLPFAASWPAIRAGYLKWLATHEATATVFASAETSHSQRLGSVELVGRIDRIDRMADGSLLVLDYKTENNAKTTVRIKEPFEDTQIAFYAALLPDDTLQAAYVNVGEQGGTHAHFQVHVVAARDALVAGIVHDMERIGQGSELPALGEGASCDYCQARGLCRKDFWA
jgi:ATP-dependent helicase/nuclease subunit B